MVLGIDLGTTFSVGAYVDEKGEARVVPNSFGDNTTPSVVFFENKDNVVVGQVAKDNSVISPKNVISLVKNSMGKPDPSTGKPVTYVTDYGEYRPEQISAIILERIVSDANKYLNLEDPITDVVVTIPAYFTDPQRKATEQAAAIAGLKCVDLINEPTAAAYYYASKAGIDNSYILVYDLGGGTFDATVIEVKGKDITVKGTGGRSKLGGSFFDNFIADYVVDEIKKKHNIDLKTPEYVFDYQEVISKSEQAKIQLSGSSRAMIPVKVDKIRENIEITREQFNGMIEKLYSDTEKVVKNTVRNAGLKLSDIEKVILVGGSSRIPYIVEKLTELFGKEPSHEVNPDEVVALGAALYAHSLKGGKDVSKISDVCSHGIGITAFNPENRTEYNEILMERNTTIPASAEKLFKLAEDGQRKLYITINEGDYKTLSDVKEICTATIELPAKLTAGTQVHIKIELDRNQMIHMYVRLPNNGNIEREVTFSRKANMSEAEITEWRKSVVSALDKISCESKAGKKRGGLFGIFDKFTGKDNESEADKPEVKKETKKEAKKKEKQIPKLVENSMDGLVGFESVKQGLSDYYNRSQIAQKRIAVGARDENSKNFVIFGARGMGCTTAARVVAEILKKMNAISGNIVLTEFETFRGKDEEETDGKIQNEFQNAMDGALIIDHFEEFYSDNPNSAEAIVTDKIIGAYHAAGEKVTLIITGDKEPIENVIDNNRKLSELFKNKITLEGFTPQEYVRLLHIIAEGRLYAVDEAADPVLERYFKGEMDLPKFNYIHRVEEVLEHAITDRANELMGKRHIKNEESVKLRVNNFNINFKHVTLEEYLKKLDDLTGLESVKKEIRALVNRLNYEKRVKEQNIQRQGEEDRPNLNMMFMGHAGTGKTTVATLLGDIFRELELLPRGHVVTATRKDLVSEFVGKTAKVVHEKILEAVGGVLFIDEAYSVCRGKDDSFGLEAIDTLVADLELYRDKMIVILAGYTDDMNNFIKNNEGFASRFPLHIEFEDYTLDEMFEIFSNMCKKNGYILEPGIEDAVKAVIDERRKVTDNFGNARGVRNLYEEVLMNMKSRLAGIPAWKNDDEAITIIKEDLGHDIVEIEHPKTVEELLDELEHMIGLEAVKAEIGKFVSLIRTNKKRKEMNLKENDIGNMHMIFSGNPGTGKTTVARLVGSIMKGLGILNKGNVIECDRSAFVAGYVGQTAIKTQQVVDSAMESVLFIDEAYTLVPKSDNDFGKEAIDILLKLLEDRKEHFMCIAAGYPDEMERFLASNPGLPRRFPRVIHFEDYSPDELIEIFCSMVKKSELRLSDGVLDKVRTVLAKRKEKAGSNFGNAGEVRNLFEQIVANMSVRADRDNLNDRESLTTIIVEDVMD